jgi:hypothetical protein
MNSLLTPDDTRWLKKYNESVIQLALDWYAWRRVLELRKSCGVTNGPLQTVQVNLPPRYKS